jgi:hypothetical protein
MPLGWILVSALVKCAKNGCLESMYIIGKLDCSNAPYSLQVRMNFLEAFLPRSENGKAWNFLEWVSRSMT